MAPPRLPAPARVGAPAECHVPSRCPKDPCNEREGHDEDGSRLEHPLAVFPDDLQWLDAATVDKGVATKVTSTRRTSKEGFR
jgi:hypothetical protein